MLIDTHADACMDSKTQKWICLTLITVAAAVTAPLVRVVTTMVIMATASALG